MAACEKYRDIHTRHPFCMLHGLHNTRSVMAERRQTPTREITRRLGPTTSEADQRGDERGLARGRTRAERPRLT